MCFIEAFARVKPVSATKIVFQKNVSQTTAVKSAVLSKVMFSRESHKFTRQRHV